MQPARPIGRLGLFAAMAAAMMPAGRNDRTASRLSAAAHKRRKCTRRLQISQGPGSISAKAELFQHLAHCRYIAALELNREHHRQCGETLAPPAVIAALQKTLDALDR